MRLLFSKSFPLKKRHDKIVPRKKPNPGVALTHFNQEELDLFGKQITPCLCRA